MGRVGSALDNAVAESFFSTLEHELLSRHRFATRAEARRRVARWIDEWYNPRRRLRRVEPDGLRRATCHLQSQCDLPLGAGSPTTRSHGPARRSDSYVCRMAAAWLRSL